MGKWYARLLLIPGAVNWGDEWIVVLKEIFKMYLCLGDSFVVLQRIPGNYTTILLATRQQSALGQHDQTTDSLVVRFKFGPHKIRSISVHTIHRNITIVVGSDHITIGLKLNTGYVGPGGRFNYIRALKETVLATMPKCEVSLAVCNDEIIV